MHPHTHDTTTIVATCADAQHFLCGPHTPMLAPTSRGSGPHAHPIATIALSESQYHCPPGPPWMQDHQPPLSTISGRLPSSSTSCPPKPQTRSARARTLTPPCLCLCPPLLLSKPLRYPNPKHNKSYGLPFTSTHLNRSVGVPPMGRIV